MCGISGILKFNSHTSLEEIKKMTDAISHRGPDGEGQWVNENAKIGFGHRRLSILDLSDAGSQPMHSICGRYTMVFNGEIYNYLELKADLEKQGEVFTTSSDTEVLLRMYILQKEACLNELDGMWAFAIWDELEQQLFCARDRFGEKPFHYYKDGNGFYFASEMKALWAAGVPKIKNKTMFALFEKEGAIHNPSAINDTFYQSIFRLEHSHWMKIDALGKIEIHRYYDIDWTKQDYKGSVEDAALEFKRLFNISLERRFRSDVKVGTSLSGGLDSSSIVCNMTKFLGKDNISPYTFSARFEGFKKDEGYFIEKVIEKTGVEAHYTWPNGQEMFDDFERLCYHQEEPFGSASIYAQFRVQQIAKEKGVTVLIDGQGADEILAGYLIYYSHYMKNLQKKNFIYSRKRKKEQDKFVEFHTPHKGIKELLIKFSFYYDIRQKLSILKHGKGKSLNEELYLSSMKGPLQDLLRYADRNSMAHSREVRLPFLNKELVEFCFSLPDEFKLQLGWTKFIMRKSFNDILPTEICWRKEKVGFEPPQNEWLKDFNSTNWKEIMMENYD
jgi:asparagine synthase (glutamine-hydrolysing)